MVRFRYNFYWVSSSLAYFILQTILSLFLYNSFILNFKWIHTEIIFRTMAHQCGKLRSNHLFWSWLPKMQYITYYWRKKEKERRTWRKDWGRRRRKKTQGRGDLGSCAWRRLASASALPEAAISAYTFAQQCASALAWSWCGGGAVQCWMNGSFCPSGV